MASTHEELLNDKLNYLAETKQLFKEVLEEKGAEISPSDTFRDYTEIIRNLNGGDVYLFKSEQEMNTFENPAEGMLAVVYNDELYHYPKFSNEKTVLNRYLIFPQFVTLNQQCINNYELPIENSHHCNAGRLYLTPTSFYLYITDKISFQVNYTSNDGIHYTRVESVNNPVDVIDPIYIIYNNTTEYNLIHPFIGIESGYFGGVYRCINGEFLPAPNQLTLGSSDQILEESGYGATGIIQGNPRSFLGNIRTSYFIDYYLNPLPDSTYIVQNLIQRGDKVKGMEYIKRRKITPAKAYSGSFTPNNCVVQLGNDSIVSVSNSPANKVIIQNYLNAQVKYNSGFRLNNKSYRIYLGYNYDTKTTDSTIPYKITSIYGFIIDLEDLSIYKTFQNTDTWRFTDATYVDSGRLCSFGYNPETDNIMLVCNTDGLGIPNTAYASLTTIKCSTGNRVTKYYQFSYSADYSYRIIHNVSGYDTENNCFYLTYKSWEGGTESIKRIIQINFDGSYSSIYTSNENMLYITWGGSNICANKISSKIVFYYSQSNSKYVALNLITGAKVYLYGNPVYDSIVVNGNFMFMVVSTNPYKLDMINMVLTKLYTTQGSVSSLYYFNNNLCIFADNKIIELDGTIKNYYYKSQLNEQGVSGIKTKNSYEYESSYLDYDVQITANNIQALHYVYNFYVYSKITELPTQDELCIVTYARWWQGTNNSTNYGVPSTLNMYQSIPITNNDDKYDMQETINNANN